METIAPAARVAVAAEVRSAVAKQRRTQIEIPDTMHSLRHRAITAVYEQSLDIRIAQEFAGHSSPQTTAGYAAYSPQRLTDAVLGIPAVAPRIVAA